MPPPKNRNLIIAGPEKTGTSSLVKLLNAHPDVCILFEVYFQSTILTKYGHKLLDRFPEARHYFYHTDDISKPIDAFFDYLAKSGKSSQYSIVGNKINTLETWKLPQGPNQKSILPFRDIRTWLIKYSIVKHYRTDLDVVRPTMAYLKALVYGFKNRNSHILWLEDFVMDNNQVIDQLSTYLSFDLSSVKDTWWKRASIDFDDPVKSIFNIDIVHPSSSYAPSKLDSQYTLKEISFWDEVSAIFDKYHRVSSGVNFSDHELDADLKRIDELGSIKPIRIHDAYESYQTERFKGNAVEASSSSAQFGGKDHLATVGQKVKHKIQKYISQLI
jgi:hypothetical protein